MKNSDIILFSGEQQKRYKGHLNLCEIDVPGQAAICRGKVLIIGAGGLGSPVALYLAAAGVGNIGIMDADRVSLSNLQRQIIHATPDIGSLKTVSASQAMKNVNPDIEITQYQFFLTSENAEGIFSDYDLIIDCTDNFETRLLINDTCVKMRKPYIFGGVSRFQGQVFTHIPGSADFRAFFGDEVPDYTEPCAVTGILNTVVGVTGSLQATEAVKFLTNTGDLLINRLLIFDALTMQFSTLSLSQD